MANLLGDSDSNRKACISMGVIDTMLDLLKVHL
jgi:hypothetical protein